MGGFTIRRPGWRRPGGVARRLRRGACDSYMALVSEFRLARIRDDAHLDRALAVIDRLLRRRLDAGGRQYLDALTDLVESYEAAHAPDDVATDADVVRALIESNRLTQARFGEQAGMSQSVVSAVVTGERRLTREQIGRIAKAFGIRPTAFTTTA